MSKEKSSKKRLRRTAAEIERTHICPVSECGKAYGSEGALKMHKKLKHDVSTKQKLYPSAKANGVYSLYPYAIYPAPLAPKLPYDPTVLEHESFSHIYPAFGDVGNLLESNKFAWNILDQPPPNLSDSILSLEDSQFDAQLLNSFSYGGIYFALDSQKRNIFELSTLQIASWMQRCNTVVDISMEINMEERSFIYYIEDCSINLDVSQPGTALKMEFSFDVISSFLFEVTEDNNIQVAIECRQPPEFHACTVPKNSIFAFGDLKWIVVKDFTSESALNFRFHILKFKNEKAAAIPNVIANDPILKKLMKSNPVVSINDKPVAITSISRFEQDLLLQPMIEQPSVGLLPTYSVDTDSSTFLTSPSASDKDSDSSNADGDFGTQNGVLKSWKSDYNHFSTTLEQIAEEVGISIDELSACACANLVNCYDVLKETSTTLDFQTLLPCRHECISIKKLLRSNTECSICSLGYYYSLCTQSVIPSASYSHCESCCACYNSILASECPH